MLAAGDGLCGGRVRHHPPAYAGRLAEVKLDTIDRILVEAGETGVLEELYPLEALRDTA